VDDKFLRMQIPMYALIHSTEPDGMKAHMLRQFEYRATMELSREIINYNRPIMISSHIEEWMDFENMYFQFHYQITVVNSTPIIIPSLVFTSHSGEIEWKCPACGTINKIEASYCGELHKHALMGVGDQEKMYDTKFLFHHPHLWGRFVLNELGYKDSIVTRILSHVEKLSGRVAYLSSVEIDINESPVLCVWIDFEPIPLSERMCRVLTTDCSVTFGLRADIWETDGDFGRCTRLSVWIPVPEPYHSFLYNWEKEWVAGR